MKTKFKISLVIAILLITSCIFNISISNATEVNEANTSGTNEIAEQTQTSKHITPKEIIDLMPNTIYLDILESEAMEEVGVGENIKFRVEELVIEQCEAILKQNNIDLKTLNAVLSFDMTHFYNESGTLWGVRYGFLEVDMPYDGTGANFDAKGITIKYKNSKNYNKTDEKYVRSKVKNIEDVLFIDTNKEKSGEFSAKKYVESVLNDPNLTVKFKWVFKNYGAVKTMYHYEIFVFKNDVQYAVKYFHYLEAPLVIVPDNVADNRDAFLEYAKTKAPEVAESDRKYLSYYPSNFRRRKCRFLQL